MGRWFPKVYDWAMKPLEKTRFKRVRAELVRGAEGHVLEIGSGTGINFPFYEQAEQVTAVEPNPLMSRRADEKLRKARVPIEICEASAEALPFKDGTFDTVIATLVFCTIPNPEQALQEIRRVSKPGARILFFEHVRMKQTLLGKAQDLLNPFWNKICDGCHLNRHTLKLIQQSGIQVTRTEMMLASLFISVEGRNPMTKQPDTFR